MPTELRRRQLRYWFFRFRTATEPNGASAKGAPRGLKKRWEAHPHFGGWPNFGVTWDLAPESTEVLVPLKESLEAEWEREAMESARPYPLPSQPDRVKASAIDRAVKQEAEDAAKAKAAEEESEA